ncbi:uncharacterized protein LOC123470097 [Daphnia magna]|uniref:uncharacterized protein LOC123470097 n=1 Tax=Daphnia magna TaxID=35525 RepID=UPI001E1BCDBC|nr:uncharacterized protein LOC123470097 [Daphnia magna]
MDGTYKITKIGFSLYHLMIVDNNDNSQPIAWVFTKEETTVAISECLRIFVENNDVSVTKVTITDKDCSEISALEKYFPDAEHILCHFHVLKAVDAWLNTLKEIDGVNKERKNDIREKFRKVLYTGTKIELDTANASLYEGSE